MAKTDVEDFVISQLKDIYILHPNQSFSDCIHDLHQLVAGSYLMTTGKWPLDFNWTRISRFCSQFQLHWLNAVIYDEQEASSSATASILNGSMWQRKLEYLVPLAQTDDLIQVVVFFDFPGRYQAVSSHPKQTPEAACVLACDALKFLNLGLTFSQCMQIGVVGVSLNPYAVASIRLPESVQELLMAFEQGFKPLARDSESLVQIFMEIISEDLPVSPMQLLQEPCAESFLAQIECSLGEFIRKAEQCPEMYLVLERATVVMAQVQYFRKSRDRNPGCDWENEDEYLVQMNSVRL